MPRGRKIICPGVGGWSSASVDSPVGWRRPDFGNVALHQTKREAASRPRKGMAIAATVLGWVGVANFLLVLLFIGSANGADATLARGDLGELRQPVPTPIRTHSGRSR